jgi:hypothetical protein
MSLLKGFWAAIAQGGVRPLAIVPHLQIPEDRAASFRAGVFLFE